MTKKSSRKARGGVLRLAVILLLSIFTAEAIIMFVMESVFDRYPSMAAIIDSTILTFALIPVLYFSVFKNLSRRNQALTAAQNSLRAAHDDLERQVEEHTSEIEQARRDLEDSLQRFADIAESTADWIWEMDENLRFSFMSPRYFEVFPTAPEDIVGKTLQEFAGPSAIDELLRRHLDDLANRRSFRDFSYTTIKSNGRPQCILVSGKPVFDADGAFKGYRGTCTDKTAEVEARSALEESEKQFRNLVEGSIQGVFVHEDGNILFTNQALADIFGYSNPDEIMALKTVEPLIAPDERERLAGYRTARRKGEYAPEIYEARGLKKDGSEIWLEYRVTRIDWRDIAAMQCVVINITERKSAEEVLQRQNEELRQRDKELNDQNERFNAALENMSQGLCMFDDEQRLVVWNERYASLYGLPSGALKAGMTLCEILEYRNANGVYAEADAKPVAPRVIAEVRSGAQGKKRRRLSNGRVIELTHHALADGGWLSTHEDITERLEADEALRESEKLFSKAFHANPAPFVISRPEDGAHYDVNEAWISALGYTREEAMAHSVLELGIWADPDKRTHFVDLLKKNGSVRNLEARFRTKSDGERDFLVSGEYVDFGGEPRLFVVSHDITALKEAEQALQQQNEELRRRDREMKEQNERFNAALENMSQGLSMFDGEQCLIVCNERYARMYDLTSDQVTSGTSLRDLVKLRVEKGIYGNTSVEEYSKEQQARIASGKPYSDIKHLNDGRVIQANYQPMSGGGWLGTHEDITEKTKTESLNLRLARIVETSVNEVYVFDTETLKFLQVNASACENLGYTMQELTELTPVDLKPEHTQKTFERLITPLMSGKKGHVRFETIHRRKDGSLYDVDVTLHRIASAGRPVFAAIIEDITERKKTQEALQNQNDELRSRDGALKDQNERFNAALDNMSQGLCMFDSEQRLVVCNQRYALMYNLPPDLLKPGILFRDILDHRIAAGVFAGDDPKAYIAERCAAVMEPTDNKKIQEMNDGSSIAILHKPLAGGGWLTTHEDITDYRRIEQRLAYLAHHDSLTDLANRVLLSERMAEDFKHARRKDGFALLYLDLDDFKGINDTLGHTAGDEVLKAVAKRLCGCVRATDMVARLGGDEFAIIQNSAQQPLDSTALAHRLCDAINAPINLGHHEVVVGASVGIALAPRDATDAEQLLRKADMALYRAKSDSRGAFRLFEPDMESSTMDRHLLGLDLRKALARDQFEIHYQPLFNLKKNKISGFEALLRWHQPERGMVSPDEFIPVAEETGLISEIGKWVLHHACAEAAGWPDDIKVAVNVSPAQFKRGNLLEVVKNALAASGLSPSRLEVEVTESVVLQDDRATLALLHQLKELGVRISMDDFGTGYSSLSYLRSFPFDKIKIDASFVHDLSGGADDIGIVHAVVGLASRLGVATTAEGVETQEQLDIVTAEGCTEAQGYFFSRPMPAKDILHLLPRPQKKAASAASAA